MARRKKRNQKYIKEFFDKKLAEPQTHRGAVALEVNRDSALANAQNANAPVTSYVVEPPETLGKGRGYTYSQEEKQFIEMVLHEQKGNISITCETTGVDISTLRKWINKGTISAYEGKRNRMRGKAHDPENKQKALDILNQTGSPAKASQATGIPESTIYTWGGDVDKYKKLSIEELNDKYEYFMAEADRVDKIMQEKIRMQDIGKARIEELENEIKELKESMGL